MEGGSPCGGRHNPLLHGTANEYCNSFYTKYLKKRATKVSISCQTTLDEEELEESAESGKTAAVEATERAAKIRAALGANVERSPMVIAALRRVAQVKAAREAAKDEAAVKLQAKDKPKAVTEVEQGPPDALESREGPINGLPDEPGPPQQGGGLMAGGS